MIYFDNAATTRPKPPSVINSMVYGLKISANPGRSGHELSLKASEDVYKVRKKLSGFFGNNSPDRVIFTQNCTQSLNMAIKGLVKKGDHVITSDLEHNSVMRVLFDLREKGIITYDVANTHMQSAEGIVASFAAHIRKNTAVIVCTHASNVFGTLLPVKEIGEMARGFGIRIIADASQSAGIIEINMEQMNIDCLCIPGHKGLYGAMGTGVLLLSGDCELEPVFYGGTGSESMNLRQPSYYPDRLESGTLNLPGIMSLGSGIDFIEGIKIDNILAHEWSITDELYRQLGHREDIIIYSSRDKKKSIPMFTFNYKNMHSEEAAARLNEMGICVRAGYHCSYAAHKSSGTSDRGAVRVSPCVYNTKNDVKNLINSINKIENT